MTSRPSDLAYERALAALTREAAESPVPELDWERIEAKLMAVDAAESSHEEASVASRASAARTVRAAPTWASTPWPIAFAAAAAAALIYSGPAGTHRAPASSAEAQGVAAEP